MSEKNFMAYGDAETVLTGVVNWADEKFSEGNVKNNGTSVTKRNTTNFTDFDIADDSTNEETDIKAHRLTSAELTEIVSPLPGTPITMPILFDETGAEYVVGWHKLANGTKKPVYEKTVSTGALPNKTTKSVAHNISNFDKCIFLNGVFQSSAAGNWNPLPYVNDSTPDANILIACSSTDIVINSRKYNWSAVSTSYVTIRYTKTTDTPS